MKKIVLIIINILLVAILAVTVAMPKKNTAKDSSIDPSDSVCVDIDGKLPDYDSINRLVQKTADKLNMNIMIYIAGSSDYDKTDGQIESFANSLYNDAFGKNTKGVVYYMDVSGRSPAYDYFMSSGYADDIYRSKQMVILDKTAEYLPPSDKTVTSADIENASEAFLRQLEVNYPKGNGNLTTLILSIVLGLVTAVIVFLAIKSHYRFKKSQDSSVYVANGKTNFREKHDMFIRKYTTKTKIQTNNGGGGGSHGGGGGHSSGSGRHR